MLNFYDISKNIPIEKALIDRGFVAVKNVDDGEVNWVAKLDNNTYAVITYDFETAQIWKPNTEMTDNEFVKKLTTEPEKIYNMCYIKNCNLATFLGFNID